MAEKITKGQFKTGKLGGRNNQHQLLREQLGEWRVRFNDNQRRRLAAEARGYGGGFLAEVATIVTPETLLAWHRKLIANKYDGNARLGPAQGKKGRRSNPCAATARLQARAELLLRSVP